MLRVRSHLRSGVCRFWRNATVVLSISLCCSDHRLEVGSRTIPRLLSINRPWWSTHKLRMDARVLANIRSDQALSLVGWEQVLAQTTRYRALMRRACLDRLSAVLRLRSVTSG